MVSEAALNYAKQPPLLVIIQGGGDVGSGVGLRLVRAGLQVLITELERPLVVRRLVSFAEAVYQGSCRVEEIEGRRVDNLAHALPLLEQGKIPVLVDPYLRCIEELRRSGRPALVFVDARMTKRPHEPVMDAAELVVGLGPGFTAGVNCHAAIETNRGHRMGRVIWQGAPEEDTGIPEGILNRQVERVLRAPVDGAVSAYAEIGTVLEPGQKIAEVAGIELVAPFKGVLRGLIYPGSSVQKGLKIADLDPRLDPDSYMEVSDKALAVGGGVLEAILSRPELRQHLWREHAA
jgi:xanthine dehydrogenase accessory factor